MADTMVRAFLDQARRIADRDAFKVKRDGEWEGITWGDYARSVRRVAGGLRSLGVDRGDKVSILSLNRPEWHVADLAVQSLGAVSVPIYVTNSPPQVAYIVGHSESKVIFCEDAGQVTKVLEKKGELPALIAVVVLDAGGAALDEFVRSYESLAAAGDAWERDHPEDFDEHAGAVGPEDLATIVYTSGTTGPPKGAMLTQSNLAWTCDSLDQILPGEPGDRKLSYLPLSHIAERMVSDMLHIWQGTETWFAQSIDTLREDLTACRPTVFFGVPRVWEKFHAGLQGFIGNLPPEQRERVEQAVGLGLKRVEALQAGTSLPPDLEAVYQEADRTVFALARQMLGLDLARVLISGAAPINPDVLRFFHAVGLPVAEVYGQTEDCGPTTINRVDAIKIGTVGPAIPGAEIRIAEDGEVLARGGNVGPGYYKDPEATAELIDSEGWMHSGDVGEIDAGGFLRITDRKKDLIITAAGKNIAPQVVENLLKYSPWISQAVVIGDRRPYLTAIVTLDQEKVAQFAEQKGIAHADFAELTRHPDVLRLVEVAVGEVNAQLAKPEQIKRWTVLERDFLQEAEEVTPTLKVRRRAINQKYAEAIDAMYA
ncbi:MAG: long-chain fatty acid--CoA ligase [Acidobacteria bacterium]|nr:long-chain fatty acid--CoA ligase [Acidobacteriota bacterium]